MMVELTRTLWELDAGDDEPALVAHGYSPPAMVVEASERALTEVILPGLQRVGVAD